jgi:hypothetical protein
MHSVLIIGGNFTKYSKFCMSIYICSYLVLQRARLLGDMFGVGFETGSICGQCKSCILTKAANFDAFRAY